MKKLHIILLIGIAAAIAIIVSNLGDLSTYETFESAKKTPGKSIVVVANLDTTQAIQHDPKLNANQFSFHAIDKNNTVHKVVFNGAKPTDFERAEQLVMTGSMTDNVFVCDKIQMKCPSKYENDQIAIATK